MLLNLFSFSVYVLFLSFILFVVSYLLNFWRWFIYQFLRIFNSRTLAGNSLMNFIIIVTIFHWLFTPSDSTLTTNSANGLIDTHLWPLHVIRRLDAVIFVYLSYLAWIDGNTWVVDVFIRIGFGIRGNLFSVPLFTGTDYLTVNIRLSWLIYVIFFIILYSFIVLPWTHMWSGH